MKKIKILHKILIVTIIISFLFSINLVSAVLSGATINDELEIIQNPAPYVFTCGEKIIIDGLNEPGKNEEENLLEKRNITPKGWWNGGEIDSYIFEGEEIIWNVIVMDMDGKENIEEVYLTFGDNKGPGNNIMAYCKPSIFDHDINNCNTEIGNYSLTEYNDNIMRSYDCIYYTETPEDVYGLYWTAVEAKDKDKNKGKTSDDLYLWGNPTIYLSINDNNLFETLEAGKTYYSPKTVIRNDADLLSGVILDLFISGTDFDGENENSYCPTENKISLEQFKYYAKKGNIDTKDIENSDSEGYRQINKSANFDSDLFYDSYEVIPKNKLPYPLDSYYEGNLLKEDEEIELTFKVDVPPICSSDKYKGSFIVWGEAI